ncbi:hypothetical protein [Herbidospora sp. RD11066]
MTKSTRAVLAIVALTAGALGALSTPAAADPPQPTECDHGWCVPLDQIKERPGENMHWGNKPLG